MSKSKQRKTKRIIKISVPTKVRDVAALNKILKNLNLISVKNRSQDYPLFYAFLS